MRISISSDPVRLGIIGVGAQGAMYSKLIRDAMVPDTSIGALCDIDPSKRAVADRIGAPFFASHLEMIESGQVDAVVTTVPHYLHPSMAIDALQRGVHALVEKPAGVYTRQVQSLLDCARSNSQLTFAIMFNQRTNPLYVDLKALLDSGALGALRHTSWIICQRP